MQPNHVLLAFERTLDQNVLDWVTRLVYADWLDENDEHALAVAQRWMARWKLAPANRVLFMGYRIRKPCAWYPARVELREKAPLHAQLPHQVFSTITGSPFLIDHRFYLSRIEAERDLAAGLEGLRKLLETSPA